MRCTVRPILESCRRKREYDNVQHTSNRILHQDVDLDHTFARSQSFICPLSLNFALSMRVGQDALILLKSSSSHMISTPLPLTYLDCFDPDILPYWSSMCMILLSKPSSLCFHIVSWNNRDIRRAGWRNEDRPDKESHRCKFFNTYQSTISNLFNLHYACRWQKNTTGFHSYGPLRFLQNRIDPSFQPVELLRFQRPYPPCSTQHVYE